MTREFKNNDQTYIYDLDKCCIDQVQRAESVARFREEQLQHPPKTINELKISKGDQYLTELFQHLLLRRLPDGTLEPYDEERAVTVTADFARALPFGEWPRLRECRKDFLQRLGISDVESIKRLMWQMDTALRLTSTEVAIPGLDVENELNANASSSGSTEETNSNGD